MTYGGYLLGHPFFWAFVAGLFAGLALAAATSVRSRRARAARDPRRVASRRWAYTWLALAGAVASVTLGVLVPGVTGTPPGGAFLTVDSLYVAGVGLVLAGVGLRFPRAGGVPVLLVVGAVAVLAAWSVRGFLPVRDERTLATITVLAVRDEQMTLEVLLDTPEAAGVPEVIVVEGPDLRATVELLDLHPGFFLLGAERFVRYAGPGGPPAAPADPDAPRDPDGPGDPDAPGDAAITVAPPLEWLIDLRISQLGRLERTDAAAERVNLLRTYRLAVPANAAPRLAVE